MLGNTLAVAQEVFGDEHMDTLVFTAKAARLQQAQLGHAATGKAQLAATVARMVETLGGSHQQTRKYQNALQEMN